MTAAPEPDLSCRYLDNANTRCNLPRMTYKLAQRGGQLIEVPAAYSSQTCAECGVVDAASRNGLHFVCAACGHQDHADTNAARIILQRGRDTSLLLSEASGCRASEERTIREIA